MTKQETLTDEQIAYIVAWATGGNEPRPGQMNLRDPVWLGLSNGYAICDDSVKLTPSALTIAALATENAKLKRETVELKRDKCEMVSSLETSNLALKGLAVRYADGIETAQRHMHEAGYKSAAAMLNPLRRTGR